MGLDGGKGWQEVIHFNKKCMKKNKIKWNHSQYTQDKPRH